MYHTYISYRMNFSPTWDISVWFPENFPLGWVGSRWSNLATRTGGSFTRSYCKLPSVQWHRDSEIRPEQIRAETAFGSVYESSLCRRLIGSEARGSFWILMVSSVGLGKLLFHCIIQSGLDIQIWIGSTNMGNNLLFKALNSRWMLFKGMTN